MKKLLLTIMMVVASSILSQAATLKSAIEMSRITDRPVFYFHSATDCSYCDRVIANIQKNEGIKTMLTRDFIFIKVNRDEVLVPAYLDTDLTPVFYILGNKGEIIFQQRGYLDDEMLTKFINLGKYKYKNRKQWLFIKKWEAVKPPILRSLDHLH